MTSGLKAISILPVGVAGLSAVLLAAGPAEASPVDTRPIAIRFGPSPLVGELIALTDALAWAPFLPRARFVAPSCK